MSYEQLILCYWGQAGYAACRISLVIKKEYNIQSSSWHKNVEKDSLYHIRFSLSY